MTISVIRLLHPRVRALLLGCIRLIVAATPMRKLCRVRSLNLVWYACGAQPTYPSLEALREDHPFFAHPPFHSQESVEQCLVSLIEEWNHTSPPVHDISMGDALPRLAFGHGPADQRTFCAELGAEIISAANKVIAIKKGTAPSGASMSLDVASWNLSSLTQWETPSAASKVSNIASFLKRGPVCLQETNWGPSGPVIAATTFPRAAVAASPALDVGNSALSGNSSSPGRGHGASQLLDFLRSSATM